MESAMFNRIAAAVLSLTFTAGLFAAETKVTIEKTHMCCGKCEKGAVTGAESVKDAKVTASKADKNIVIVAKDEKSAQAAVDALAKAGYHGEIKGDKNLKWPADQGGSAGAKQQTVTVSGFHNCCNSCATPINKAIAATKGATAPKVEKNQTEVTVSGNFDSAELVKNLNAAGYHVSVK
jgi:copper chaperone CopZ